MKVSLISFLIIFISIQATISANSNTSTINNMHAIYQNKILGTKVENPNCSNKINDEKIHHSNKIIRIWIGADGLLNVTAEIKDNKETLRISIFNMLGKEIMKIYENVPQTKNEDGDYVFISDAPVNFPKNVYILVLQGASYKIADKFIIAK